MWLRVARACSITSTMSSTSPRPSSCSPSVPPTPRKLKRNVAIPASRNAFPRVVTTLLSMVPPKSGCGCAITATAWVFRGTLAATSILPAAPSSSARVVPAGMLDPQALDDAPVHEVLVDDLVDVVLVHVGVPDLLGIDDDDRPFLAAVEAARLVDADHALAVELELLDALLGVFLHRLGAMAGAAVLGRIALVEAKEDVVLVVAHAAILDCAASRRSRKNNPIRNTIAATGQSSCRKRVSVAKLPSCPWGQRKSRTSSSAGL